MPVKKQYKPKTLKDISPFPINETQKTPVPEPQVRTGNRLSVGGRKLSAAEEREKLVRDKADIAAMKSGTQGGLPKQSNMPSSSSNIMSIRAREQEIQAQRAAIFEEAIKAQPEELAKQAIQEQYVAGQRPIQNADINLSDPNSLANQGTLLGAGLAGMGAGALKGAAIGTAVAPGIGTVIGGVAGTIAGTAAAVYTKTAWTNVQDMSGAFGVYTSSAGNIDWITNEVNAGRMKESEAWVKWDEEVGKVRAAQTFMKTKTDDELDKFTAPGAIGKMAKIDAYIRRIDQKERNLAVALAAPDSSKIIGPIDYGVVEMQ